MTGEAILTRTSREPGAGRDAAAARARRLAHEMTVAEAARRHAFCRVDQPKAEPVRRRRRGAAMEDGMPGKAGAPRQPGRATASRGDSGTQAGAGRGDGAATDLAERFGVRRPGPFAVLEARREAAQLPVARFARLAASRNAPSDVGLQRCARTATRRKDRGLHRRSTTAEALAAKYASD